MKKLKRLKLNRFAQDILNEQEMNILRGGGTPGTCTCCCGYEDHGGSTQAVSSPVNNSYGYTESYGCGDGSDDGDYTEDRVRLMSTGFCAC